MSMCMDMYMGMYMCMHIQYDSLRRLALPLLGFARRATRLNGWMDG